MSKAVLISIRPKWCELIFKGRKTMELRKTNPSFPLPFKAFVYCTNSVEKIITIGPDKIMGNGLVCAEFICDHILGHCEMANADIAEQQSLVRRESIYDYSGYGNREIFGWHITDLKIYDKPRPLTNYHRPCPESLHCESCAMWSEQRGCGNAALQITRPPQSWCYVEEQP